MFVSAALVMLVIAVFLVSEDQIATVVVALGVGAYICLSYLSTKEPPSPSPSPSPAAGGAQQDVKKLDETNKTLHSENEMLKHENALLTKDIDLKSEKIKNLERMEQEYDRFKKQVDSEKKAQASNDHAGRDAKLQENQDLKKQNETLAREKDALTKENQESKKRNETLASHNEDLKKRNETLASQTKDIPGLNQQIATLRKINQKQAGLVTRDDFVKSEPDCEGEVSALAQRIYDYGCTKPKCSPILIPCQSDFIKNAFPYHQVVPSFFSPEGVKQTLGSIRGAFGITTRNPGTFLYVKMFEWPRLPQGQSFHKKDIAGYKINCKVVATYFVAGDSTTFFLAPKAPVNVWQLVCVSPRGMKKEEFQKLIEDCQFEELDKKGACVFPRCTKTDILECDEWTETQDPIFEIQTADYEIDVKNGVKCDLLA